VVMLHSLLSDKGSIFVHLDWHVGHYAKLVLDEVFGTGNFRNEIVWHYYNKMQGNINRFASNHDTIFWYARDPSRVKRLARPVVSVGNLRAGGSGKTPDSARAIAQGMIGSYGWSSSQFQCLNLLWNRESGWKVYAADFVTTDTGTGIAHEAPAFGADDYKVGKKYDIGILTMVDKQGKFVDGLGEFSNRYVKNYKDDPKYVDVNVDIAVKLKKENRAFKVEKYEHSYPHCWRTDKPILYYPLDAWFIKTTAVKERMVELNKTINWKPSATSCRIFS